MDAVELKFFKLNQQAKIPAYAHAGDSGMDISSLWSYTIQPNEYLKIATGIGAVIPHGFELQVRPRSGLQTKHGIVCAWGTVDEGYRGEIGVVLYNHSDKAYLVKGGDRVAQLVLAPVVRAAVGEIDAAEARGDSTSRGGNGFGSTGR